MTKKAKAVLAASASAIALLLSSYFYFVSKFLVSGKLFDPEGEDKNYHVLVLGKAENSVVVNKVFDGAKKLGERYSAIVELHTPNSLAENISLQSLVDYASFVNADGIIAYIDEDVKRLEAPFRTDGTRIPLIALGHYSPDIPQVTYIGSNYSELGRKIALETIPMLSENETVRIISSKNFSTPNFSNMMSTIHSIFSKNGVSNFETLDKSSEENEIRIAEICAGDEPSLFLCLSENDAMLAVRAIYSEKKKSGTKIISIGNNEIISEYLNKGLVDKIIAPDHEKIGELAIRELFEYRNKGYANNYMTADFLVRTATSEAQ